MFNNVSLTHTRALQCTGRAARLNRNVQYTRKRKKISA